MLKNYEKQMTNLFGISSSKDTDPFIKLQLLSDPIIRGFTMSKYYPSNMYEDIIIDKEIIKIIKLLTQVMIIILIENGDLLVNLY